MSEIINEDEYLELTKDGFITLCTLGSFKLLDTFKNTISKKKNSYMIIDEDEECIYKVSSAQADEFIAGYICGMKGEELHYFMNDIIINNID